MLAQLDWIDKINLIIPNKILKVKQFFLNLLFPVVSATG